MERLPCLGVSSAAGPGSIEPPVGSRGTWDLMVGATRGRQRGVIEQSDDEALNGGRWQPPGSVPLHYGVPKELLTSDRPSLSIPFSASTPTPGPLGGALLPPRVLSLSTRPLASPASPDLSTLLSQAGVPKLLDAFCLRDVTPSGGAFGPMAVARGPNILSRP